MSKDIFVNEDSGAEESIHVDSLIDASLGEAYYDLSSYRDEDSDDNKEEKWQECNSRPNYVDEFEPGEPTGTDSKRSQRQLTCATIATSQRTHIRNSDPSAGVEGPIILLPLSDDASSYSSMS